MEPLSPLVLGYAKFRLAVFLFGLVLLALLWKKPRPHLAVFGWILINIATWAASVQPMQRLYSLEEHLDRSFDIGTIACIAAGNSPFEHMQVGFANLEPLWFSFVAMLSGFHPERVVPLYHWIAPVSIFLTILGLYFGTRDRAAEDDAAMCDRWERFLIVFAVLGLASTSVGQRTLIPPLWAAAFLLKPNHTLAWALVGVLVGLWTAKKPRILLASLVLALVAWIFILTWAYVAAGLLVACFLATDIKARLKQACAIIGLSFLMTTPLILHLMRDHGPTGGSATSKQMWNEPLGQILAVPTWSTIDLGILLLLATLGALVAWRRRSLRDGYFIGMGIVGALGTLAFALLSFIPFTPEPDELHYFYRIALGFLAGIALASCARMIERWRGLRMGRGHLIVFTLFLPLSFPAYWDPPTMDRYFRWCLTPIRPKILSYAEWIRANTPPQSIFIAGRSACIWIPVLTGRRVLLAETSRPPADVEERLQAQRTLLLASDTEQILATARRYGITHVAVDSSWIDRYGESRMAALGRLPVYRRIFSNSAVRLYRIVDPAQTLPGDVPNAPPAQEAEPPLSTEEP